MTVVEHGSVSLGYFVLQKGLNRAKWELGDQPGTDALVREWERVIAAFRTHYGMEE